MTISCADCSTCCAFIRGTVYLRGLQDFAFRSVGNASQLRILHDRAEYLPLDGDLSDCCGWEAVQAQLALRCLSEDNLPLALRGDSTVTESETVTDEFLSFQGPTATGAMLPFSKMADPSTVQVLSPLDIKYSVHSFGIILNEPICNGTVSVRVQYTSKRSRKVKAGQGCEQIYECLFVGTNAFDGSQVSVRIPRVRWKPVSSFDWISTGTDAVEMLLEGTVLPNADPQWYEITRAACEPECCDLPELMTA